MTLAEFKLKYIITLCVTQRKTLSYVHFLKTSLEVHNLLQFECYTLTNTGFKNVISVAC